MEDGGIVQSPIGQLTINRESFPFQLSWTHYQVLMTIDDAAERSFYELEAIKGAWNVKTLKRQYHSSLYERIALSRDKNDVMEMAKQGAMPYKPEDILKSPYVLEFAGLDDKSFYCDLVLYNRFLRCFVLIDFKVDELTHQDLGQMQMYVNYYDRYETVEGENPTIGILMCKKSDEALVELTLPEDANIYAKEYRLYLPDKKLLQEKLQEWLEESE